MTSLARTALIAAGLSALAVAGSTILFNASQWAIAAVRPPADAPVHARLF